jgi:hypothetical protein
VSEEAIMSAVKDPSGTAHGLPERPPEKGGAPSQGDTLRPEEQPRKLHGDKLEDVASGTAPCKEDKGGVVH